MQGGLMPLPPSGLVVPTVTLQVFVDRSLLEVQHPFHWTTLQSAYALVMRLCRA